MAKKATKSKRTGGTTKSGAKNSLVGNINRRKKAGTSRTKKNSTISDSAYEQMQKGWPKTTKRKARKS